MSQGVERWDADTPLALAETDAIIYDGIDGHTEEDTTGQAATNPGLEGLTRLSTFVNGDKVRLYRNLAARRAPRDPTWGRPRVVRFTVDLQPPRREAGDTDVPSSVDDSTQYYVTGDVEAGNQGFGFKLSMVSGSATLEGVVHDGTTETTVDLSVPSDVPPGSGRVHMSARLEGDQIRFFVEGREVGSTGAIVSGTSTAERLFTASVENLTSAPETRETDVDVRVVQL